MIKHTMTFLLTMVSFAGISLSGVSTNHLEPEDGVFAGHGPDPYYLALRDTLLGEHHYRLCQVFAVTSFEPEWAVYLLRGDVAADRKPDNAQVIYKVLKTNLWYEMMKRIEQSSNQKGSISLSNSAQTAALSKLTKNIDRAASPISETTAALLEQVWVEMLAGVRYPKPDGVVGLDGVTYHVSHWSRLFGFRSGTTWSPDRGTNTGALIDIAEGLKEYALAQSKDRPVIDASIAAKAKALLLKLKKEKPL